MADQTQLVLIKKCNGDIRNIYSQYGISDPASWEMDDYGNVIRSDIAYPGTIDLKATTAGNIDKEESANISNEDRLVIDIRKTCPPLSSNDAVLGLWSRQWPAPQINPVPATATAKAITPSKPSSKGGDAGPVPDCDGSGTEASFRAYIDACVKPETRTISCRNGSTVTHQSIYSTELSTTACREMAAKLSQCHVARCSANCGAGLNYTPEDRIIMNTTVMKNMIATGIPGYNNPSNIIDPIFSNRQASVTAKIYRYQSCCETRGRDLKPGEVLSGCYGRQDIDPCATTLPRVKIITGCDAERAEALTERVGYLEDEIKSQYYNVSARGVFSPAGPPNIQIQHWRSRATSPQLNFFRNRAGVSDIVKNYRVEIVGPAYQKAFELAKSYYGFKKVSTCNLPDFNNFTAGSSGQSSSGGVCAAMTGLVAVHIANTQNNQSPKDLSNETARAQELDKILNAPSVFRTRYSGAACVKDLQAKSYLVNLQNTSGFANASIPSAQVNLNSSGESIVAITGTLSSGGLAAAGMSYYTKDLGWNGGHMTLGVSFTSESISVLNPNDMASGDRYKMSFQNMRNGYYQLKGEDGPAVFAEYQSVSGYIGRAYSLHTQNCRCGSICAPKNITSDWDRFFRQFDDWGICL